MTVVRVFLMYGAVWKSFHLFCCIIFKGSHENNDFFCLRKSGHLNCLWISASKVWVQLCCGGREWSRGGGTPLYGLYRYVQHQRVCFFSHFGHK